MAQEFRADIEGLRALAITPILLFHLNPSWCPGGFIGVDIFFVISGFLITRLILSDGPRFSFREFYVRRFFRLFPALLVTLIATTAGAWRIAGPEQYEDLAKSAIASVFGLSNFYFWLTIDYFNASASDHPLLHTWSLGAEEQFYLIWPTLLLLIRGRTGKVLLLASAVGATSLAGLILLRPMEPEATFYMMPFRMFEFAIGASVVAFEVSGKSIPGLLSEVAGWVAIAVIAACLVTLEGTTSWPGIATLVPALATAALILLGGRGSAGAILQLMPIRLIGRMSYSLYLVHWPIIALYRANAIVEPGELALAGVGLASVALAATLHFIVEKPFTRANRADPRLLQRYWSIRPQAAAGVLALGSLALLAGATSVLATSGFPSRLDRHRVQYVDNGLTYAGDLCSPKRAECIFGDRHSSRTVYLMGDSHALNLVHGLDRLFASRGIRGIALYDHGCLFAASTFTFVNGVADQRCARNVAYAYEYLAAHGEPVIIAMNYTGYRKSAGDAATTPLNSANDANYLLWLRERLESGIARLNPGRRRIVIFKETYNTGIDLAKCLTRPGMSKADADAQCSPSRRTNALAQAASVDRMIEDLTHRLAGLVAVDPKIAFCDTELCRTREGDALYFRDKSHLTNEGSDFLIERLKSELLPMIGSAG